jgi:hypothetical protein
MTIRRQGALALGVVLLAVIAGCGRPGKANWKFNGPPQDSRYLGVAVLTSDSASVKSDRVATKNGARVDFYLVNLTSGDWKATVSFPEVPPAVSICRATPSNITDVALPGESDATAKCLLDNQAVDDYCDSIAPPADPKVQGDATVQGGAHVRPAPRPVCEIEYTITFTSPDGKKKVVDPRLEVER